MVLLLTAPGEADDNRSLSDRTRQYLTDLIRLDTSNPPGNETRVAEYLKQVADSHGISAELLGSDPRRMNFVARLRGNGRGNRPLLLMAHSDVVPAERSEWSVDPFSAEVRNGYLYGRGAQDDKSLLAAELAVMVELKRRNIRLNRDLILLSEADEESGSTGIQWLIQHEWPKVDAEFALNEGGYILETKDGPRLFQIQTTEKIPTRVVLTARGTAGHGSLPRADNPVLHLARALVKLSDAEQPVHLNATTRRYLRELEKFPDYGWLSPLVPRLENFATAQAAASQVHLHDPELDAMLRTTISATMLRAGIRVNVIPNTAEAQVDARRLPNETREEVLLRIRQIINDSAVEVTPAPGQQPPPAEPSSVTTTLYRGLERAIGRVSPHDSVVPFMSRIASDGSYLRARGVAVYGVPIFTSEGAEGREHGNDERIAPKNLDDGVELLWQMILETAGAEARSANIPPQRLNPVRSVVTAGHVRPPADAATR
jgi:acetylornithine deacetylase/succinyl-diaminopimelate desuccinylase-like protein